jgi:hypothetical protein
MHHGGRTFQIDFDFVDHRLVVRTARGDVEWFELADGLSVAEFDSSLHQVLDGLGVDAAVREIPYGLPMTTPFPEEGWSSRRTNRRTPRAPNRSNRGHARNARLRPSRWSIFSGTASTLR